MSNKTSMFVPVGKNIFDLNSITNITYIDGKAQVYVTNNTNGFELSDKEYQQLLDYYFSHKDIPVECMIPKYVLVGKNMFNTTMITHVMDNNKVLVYINNNPNGMEITDDEYQLLIKYLLANSLNSN